jgi:hypothetical protein
MLSLLRFPRPCAITIFLLPLLYSPANAADTPGDTTIEFLLGTMTMEEKAGQMILVYHSDYEFLSAHKPGGVLIMQNMLEKPSALRAQLLHAQEKLPIPLFVAIDQEGGAVNRLSPLTGWKKTPSAQKLSAWDPDSIRAYSRQVGAKLKHLGINMNLAPVMDPAMNHQGIETFMGLKSRSFGKDAEHIVPAARAFIEGFSDQNILCVAKHFPGYDAPTNSDPDHRRVHRRFQRGRSTHCRHHDDQHPLPFDMRYTRCFFSGDCRMGATLFQRCGHHDRRPLDHIAPAIYSSRCHGPSVQVSRFSLHATGGVRRTRGQRYAHDHLSPKGAPHGPYHCSNGGS